MYLVYPQGLNQKNNPSWARSEIWWVFGLEESYYAAMTVWIMIRGAAFYGLTGGYLMP